MCTTFTALLLAAWSATAAASIPTTPFELLEDGSIVVPVTIGGTGPYRFILDTGSSRTVISTRLSRELRLPVVARTLMVMPAGRDIANVVRLNGLAIEGRPGVDVSAAVMPADRAAAGQYADGLIGQDMLAAVVYTIDYHRREVAWHAPGATLPGIRLPLTVHDNRLRVSLAQRDGDPRPLSLIPDSGSDGLVVFAHAQDKLRLTTVDVGVLTSLSGSRAARRVQVDSLMVGNIRLQNPLAVVVDTGEAEAMMGDGLLPLHLFARVTVNAGEGYLIVQPR
jgi:predicted aspartyl protease